MKYLSKCPPRYGLGLRRDEQSRVPRIAAVLTLVIWFVWHGHLGRVCLGHPAPDTGWKPVPQNLVKRVLIVTGIDHPAHNWRQTAPALAEVLQKDPRLQVRIVEDPHFLDSSALQRYDVVVLHFMNWQQPAPGPYARSNLREFVHGGKGLFIVHFACGAFQDWPEFRNLAGRVWDPKLRAHDPRGPFQVNITDVNHPITQGMQSFETDDELYTCLAGDRAVKVLATARSKIDGKDYPMAFAFNYGKGRVFHSLLGHDVKAIRKANVAELFRRGCAWAAGLTVVPQPKAQTDVNK